MKSRKTLILSVSAILIIFSSYFTPILSKSRSFQDLEVIEGVEIINNGQKTYRLVRMENATLYENSSFQVAVLEEVRMNNKTVEWGPVKVDEDGNPYVELKLIKWEIKPGEAVNFSAITKVRVFDREIVAPEISVENSGHLDDIPVENMKTYLKATPLYQTDDAGLRKLAFSLRGNETNVLKIILNFLDWFEKSIVYPLEEARGNLRPPLYPNETFEEGIGDCDDQTNLFITLCRIVGIPAYAQTGYIFHPYGSEETATYAGGRYFVKLLRVGGHGWAMVYIPPWAWLPVDLTYFRDASIDSEGHIRSSKLIDHIVGSAFFTKTVVVAYKTVRTDYIAETMNWIKDLYDYNLTWREYVELRLSTVETPTATITTTTLPTTAKHLVTTTSLTSSTHVTTVLTAPLSSPSLPRPYSLSTPIFASAVIVALLIIIAMYVKGKEI